MIVPVPNDMNPALPMMYMPAIAMITVPPETSTARPEVADAIREALGALPQGACLIPGRVSQAPGTGYPRRRRSSSRPKVRPRWSGWFMSVVSCPARESGSRATPSPRRTVRRS